MINSDKDRTHRNHIFNVQYCYKPVIVIDVKCNFDNLPCTCFKIKNKIVTCKKYVVRIVFEK